MNKNILRISLLSAVAFGMVACSEDIDLTSEVSSVQTRSSVDAGLLVNLSQNPVYTLGAKGSNGIYDATTVSAGQNSYLTNLEFTLHVPENVTLTGISVTASDKQVLCGEFICNDAGVVSTSASANYQLFAEFKNAKGEYHLKLKKGEGIHFTLPLAPTLLKGLTVCMHTIGNVIYKTEVNKEILPGSSEVLDIKKFNKIQGNQWLSLLDDKTPITRLSLPGTHDAATGEGTSLSIGMTQSLSLQQQWDMGIRVFDLRPGYKKVRKGFFKYENQLHIYHGVVEANISFDQAIKCITANLQKNPNEFAVVVMRFENSSLIYNDRNVWNSLMNSYLSKSLPQQFKVDYRPDLTLGDVRGKLLILSRDAYANRPVTGGFISGWSHSENGSEYGQITSPNGGVSALNIQDDYEVTNLDTKCSSMRHFIDLASAAENGRLTINHASGYTTDTDYNTGVLKNAAATQGGLYNYLTSEERVEGSAGIVLMDRVGVRSMKKGRNNFVIYGDLAPQALINNNFKFKLTR